MSTSRLWQIQGSFGLQHLTLTAQPIPTPGPGQLLLRVRATSLNYRDLLMARGAYDPRLPLPFVPLSDGVGEVVGTGEGTTTPMGTRVCATFSPTWLAGDPDQDALRKTRGGRVPGMLADHVVVEESATVRPPAHLSDCEAATLPCAALTAWSALVTLGGLAKGDTVLTLGTGGVSLFALQLAKAHGARVVATTSTPEKAVRLQALGADHVVLYSEDPRWGRTVRTWSEGGVDHVIEVGGAGTLAQSLAATRPGGTVSLIGVLDGDAETVSVLPILMKQVRVQGVFVGSRAGFEAMNTAIASHALRPVLDKTFPLAQADEAFAWFAARKHFGKVVIDHT